MTNPVRFTVHEKYACKSCDCTFDEPAPMKGYWFDSSSGWRDEDGDAFFEGDKKILIGKETYCCHNEEYSCFISESDWTEVKCEGYRCSSCGVEYTWDNEHCSEHSFSYNDTIEKHCEAMAAKCCAGQSTADVSPAGSVAILSSPQQAPAKKVVQVEF